MPRNFKSLPIFGLCVLLFSPSLITWPDGNNVANEFVFKRGTNISHWLSQSSARGEQRKNYFTEKDVKYLASIGFDHIRIPVDEEQMWKEDGTKDAEAFSLLKQALDWCSKYKLDAVVDL